MHSSFELSDVSHMRASWGTALLTGAGRLTTSGVVTLPRFVDRYLTHGHAPLRFASWRCSQRFSASWRYQVSVITKRQVHFLTRSEIEAIVKSDGGEPKSAFRMQGKEPQLAELGRQHEHGVIPPAYCDVSAIFSAR